MPKEKKNKRPGPAAKPEAQPGPHHVADEPIADPDSAGATVQSPVTETGLVVEEQVRKEWDPKKNGGLPTPLRTGNK